MSAIDRFRVVGGARLAGEVSVSGAKNSALKLMAASLLAAGKTTIRNVPDIADVDIMADLLTRLGCTVEHGQSVVTIDVPEVPGHRADYDLVRKMRASINVLGPLVARVGQAEVALPGGDAIGSRGLDFHIRGLESLGAKAHNEHGYVIAEAPNGLTGAEIVLDFPSGRGAPGNRTPPQLVLIRNGFMNSVCFCVDAFGLDRAGRLTPAPHPSLIYG